MGAERPQFPPRENAGNKCARMAGLLHGGGEEACSPQEGGPVLLRRARGAP